MASDDRLTSGSRCCSAYLEQLKIWCIASIDQLQRWLSGLTQTFGSELLLLLVASEHLLMGLLQTMVNSSTSFLFAAYAVEAQQMQVYNSILGLAGTLKPVIGLLSDSVPLCGYHKMSYMLPATILAVIALTVIGVAPPAVLSVGTIVCLLVMVRLQISTCHLLVEVSYFEQLREKPQAAPDLVSFVTAGKEIFNLLGATIVGATLLRFGVKVVFMLAVVPASFILWPLSWNALSERRLSQAEANRSWKQLQLRPETVILSLVMLASSIVLSATGLHRLSIWRSAGCALLVVMVNLAVCSLLLNPTLAKVNAFFLLKSCLHLRIGGAAFYFYTDGPEQYPEGPHMSKFFVVAVMRAVTSVCHLLGVASYNKYMRGWRYRSLIAGASLLHGAIHMSDCIFFARWNKLMGLPDSIFVLGGHVLEEIVGDWMRMPAAVMYSQLCPKGMEATTYALLFGCQNLGQVASQSWGALLLHYFGINPRGSKGESMQFEYLYLASAVSSLLALLPLLLLPLLVPDARQTEALAGMATKDMTAGSLWSQLWRKHLPRWHTRRIASWKPPRMNSKPEDL